MSFNDISELGKNIYIYYYLFTEKSKQNKYEHYLQEFVNYIPITTNKISSIRIEMINVLRLSMVFDDFSINQSDYTFNVNHM